MFPATGAERVHASRPIPNETISTPQRSKSSTLRISAVILALIGSIYPGLGGVNVAAIGLIFASLAALGAVARWLPRVHPVLANMVALFTLLSCSILWTDLPSEYGEEKLTTFLTITLLSALLAMNIQDERDLRRLAVLWPLIMVPVALATLADFEGGRSGGFGANPIWVARALVTGMIFALWRVWFDPLKSRPLLLLGIIAVLGAALIATGSRGPLLGLAVAVLILALLRGRGRIMKIAILVYAFTVVGYGIVYTDFFETSRIVESVEEGTITDQNGRDAMIGPALDAVQANPEGVGAGNISDYWRSRHLYPHNIFVEVLAEHGVIVGVIFAFVVARAAVKVLMRARHNNEMLLLAALLLAEIVNVSFSGDLNARTFFFVLSLSLWMLFRDRHGLAHVPPSQRDTSTGTGWMPPAAHRPPRS